MYKKTILDLGYESDSTVRCVVDVLPIYSVYRHTSIANNSYYSLLVYISISG